MLKQDSLLEGQQVDRLIGAAAMAQAAGRAIKHAVGTNQGTLQRPAPLTSLGPATALERTPPSALC